MAGSSSQVSKQAFHETYDLKEELGKWVFLKVDLNLAKLPAVILINVYISQRCIQYCATVCTQGDESRVCCENYQHQEIIIQR